MQSTSINQARKTTPLKSRGLQSKQGSSNNYHQQQQQKVITPVKTSSRILKQSQTPSGNGPTSSTGQSTDQNTHVILNQDIPEANTPYRDDDDGDVCLHDGNPNTEVKFNAPQGYQQQFYSQNQDPESPRDSVSDAYLQDNGKESVTPQSSVMYGIVSQNKNLRASTNNLNEYQKPPTQQAALPRLNSDALLQDLYSQRKHTPTVSKSPVKKDSSKINFQAKQQSSQAAPQSSASKLKMFLSTEAVKYQQADQKQIVSPSKKAQTTAKKPTRPTNCNDNTQTPQADKSNLQNMQRVLSKYVQEGHVKSSSISMQSTPRVVARNTEVQKPLPSQVSPIAKQKVQPRKSDIKPKTQRDEIKGTISVKIPKAKAKNQNTKSKKNGTNASTEKIKTQAESNVPVVESIDGEQRQMNLETPNMSKITDTRSMAQVSRSTSSALFDFHTQDQKEETFKPKINKKSEKMLANRQRLPIFNEERWQEDQRRIYFKKRDAQIKKQEEDKLKEQIELDRIAQNQVCKTDRKFNPNKFERNYQESVYKWHANKISGGTLESTLTSKSTSNLTKNS